MDEKNAENLSMEERSEFCTFSSDTITLAHSFGYDCQKPYNLAALDDSTVAFITGCFLVFYDINSKKSTYRKSLSSEGFGNMVTHPTKPYLAVGENGVKPLLIIYEYNSSKLREKIVLHGGAARGFSHLNFNPDGSLLGSQSIAPDFLLTIWMWEEDRVLLRTSAYNQSVLCVQFSAFIPDQLTTCGVGHIKFWRMSNTFTGLKLKGEPGRFGKTESCDLFGALPLPNGSVASGSSWGNILIWHCGAIRMEVFRVGKLPCHSAAITQLVYANSTILTGGLDGAVRMWSYDALEVAVPDEEDFHVQLEPVKEILIQETDTRAEILSFVKVSRSPECNRWYLQDASGGIWDMDAGIGVRREHGRRLLQCHSGAVVSVVASPVGSTIASIGTDGRLFMYDYVKNSTLGSAQFNSPGECLLWLPLSVVPSGTALIIGFSDGVLRVINLGESGVEVIQAEKPHIAAVSAMASCSEELLVTGGQDATIFFFHIEHSNKFPLKLHPIGFCSVDSQVSCLSWGHSPFLFVGTAKGNIYRFEIPTTFEKDEHTLQLNLKCTTLHRKDFLQQLAQRKVEDEENETSEDQLIIVPEYPVSFLWCSPRDSVCFSYGEPGSNIFEYNFNKNVLIRTITSFTRNSGISSWVYCKHDNCLLLGFENGKIQGIRWDDNLNDWWQHGVHHRDRGKVLQLSFSWDSEYIFSCGSDGGLFSFKSKLKKPKRKEPKKIAMKIPRVSRDITDPKAPSIQEARMKINHDTKVEIARIHKNNVLKIIKQIREDFKSVLDSNASLPNELTLEDNDLIPDPRIVDDLSNSLAKKDKGLEMIAREVERSNLLQEKIHNYFFDDVEIININLEAIRGKEQVETFRLTKLGMEFDETLLMVKQRLNIVETKGRSQNITKPPEAIVEVAPEGPNAVDTLLKQVMGVADISRDANFSRLLRRYQDRRVKAEAHLAAWQEILRRKPSRSKFDPEDLFAIEHARDTLGDYNLKTSADYKVPKHLKVTTVNRYDRLLEARQRIYNIKREFNKKVLSLRDEKEEMIKRHAKLREDLHKIAVQIPEQMRKPTPLIPTFNEESEFPERKFQYVRESLKSPQMQSLTVQQSLKVAPTLKKQVSGYSVAWEGSQLQKMAFDNTTETAWEAEMREQGISKSIEEQDVIIREINNDIDVFDQEVRRLSNEKVQIEMDVKFLELFLLTLHREILVLKTFEEEEEEKTSLSFSCLKEKEALQTEINDVSTKVESKVREIESNEEKMKVLVSTFYSTVSDNPFFEYLKRIFKKKFKPPKIEIDDDSEASSSSDSESYSDESDKSIDLKDFDWQKLSEDVCPEFCDKALYEHTFTQRAERHVLENTILEMRKEVEFLKKQFDIMIKKVAQVGQDYNNAQRDMEEFQRKKQSVLNEIETVVILRLSQFQNFIRDDTLEKIADSVVIGSELLSKLYNRVGELERETKQQKERHALNKQHLQRMGVDINHMNQLVLQYNNDIEQTMLRKFGMKVDLNELEECMLKRLVAEMNFVSLELERDFDKKLNALRHEVNEKQDAYTNSLVKNTERYNILTILHEEKSKLERILLRQEEKMEMPVKEEVTTDLEKLENIARKQEAKIKHLRDQIEAMKYKARLVDDGLDIAGHSVPPLSQEPCLQNTGPAEYQDLPLTDRDVLRDIVEEMEDIAADIQTGFVTEAGTNRLRHLVRAFMEKIPEGSLGSLLNELGEEVDENLEDLDTLIKVSKLASEMVEFFVPIAPNDND